MKRILYFFSVMLCILAVTGCQDRDIIDFKDGVSLPPVTDLKSSLTPDNDAVLEWKLPSAIPEEIQRPLSVYVQVYKGAVLEHQISLEGEPTSWEYTLKEPESKYRIVVKVQGMLKEKPYGQSDEIYSLGQTGSVGTTLPLLILCFLTPDDDFSFIVQSSSKQIDITSVG